MIEHFEFLDDSLSELTLEEMREEVRKIVALQKECFDLGKDVMLIDELFWDGFSAQEIVEALEVKRGF